MLVFEQCLKFDKNLLNLLVDFKQEHGGKQSLLKFRFTKFVSDISCDSVYNCAQEFKSTTFGYLRLEE